MKAKTINPVTFSEFKKKALQNRAIKHEYDKLGPRFILIKTLIRKRLEKGLSQKQLAEKIHTKQSAISRLESGNANPSLAFLTRIAKALNSKLVIIFQ